MFAVKTNATCNMACWFAKEDQCRCSCAGENHGLLLNEGNEQPIRKKRSNNRIYELSGVVLGNRNAREYAREQYQKDGNDGWLNTSHNYYDSVGDYHVEQAKMRHLEWPELATFNNMEDWKAGPCIIWKRIQ